MKPKEKAKELFDKFYYLFPKKHKIDFGYKESKECALIAVDEIIRYTYIGKAKYKNDDNSFEFWQEVKKEIEKL